MTQPAPLYTLCRICHFYGSKKVLDIDEFSIPPGTILGLSGPNGSGKTTLLKLLAFAMAPSRGEIHFNGRREYPMSARVRSKVTLMTQTPYLLKRSVLDNVVYGLKIRKDTKRLKQRAARALAAVGLDFDAFHNRAWHQLSGGEAQRVCLAARLILEPQALLLDEPVASVDAESARLIRQASLAARDKWGCTLIIVSHDLTWLNAVSDTRVSMEKGRIFSTHEEIILSPPYQTMQTDSTVNWVLPVSRGRHISLPDKTGETALIPADKINIAQTSENQSDEKNRIPVLVTRMALEPKTGRIEVDFDADTFRLTLLLSEEQAGALNLQPGKKRSLIFKTRDIFWR
ncbi:tungsten ABC transporter ATP-binding protein [Desulfobacter hydrogenophilus]|uniref:ATP-binding cassette domain-containing protein n=1 Tax=Desulfobacter hydrogenophilus TaxID=2291 RepID=A0A328F774_9BACT|nr:ATP-binding cassette domain-containing protein [Desulfobacter hydrogenophilus]NDY74384.1 ATP-binding cassette domain-containing protein [Desulfobacter hydrogenophilus]QBH14604.1 ATP-binding cassette domain-containing protein [Desulfobacter hydrogenophilus]RAM00408.1 tungsten ABC transporter ATP-binding protein [Desulfobacter hydrogenophilus]